VSGHDLLSSQDLRREHSIGDLLRPQHIDVARRERAADQRPVGVDEAQHSAHRQSIGPRLGKRRAHQLDLLLHAVDELGAVPPADHQRLGPRAHQAALHP